MVPRKSRVGAILQANGAGDHCAGAVAAATLDAGYCFSRERSMRRSGNVRSAMHARTRRASRARVPLFAVVDIDRIPARCFGDPLCVAAADRRCEKAYEALCESLWRNRQVGITTVELDGVPRVAALVPIGGVLAVSPLLREYTDALADGLRGARRAKRRAQRYDGDAQERRAAA